MKIKVLIVDDSVIYRSQIKEALEQLPIVESIGSASNGKIAIEKMKQQHFDLVILDMEMPELNGLETLRQIKDLNLKSKIIVFSSTSVAGARTTLEALSLGASDFIAKPSATPAGSSEVGKSPSARIRILLEPKIMAFFGDTIVPDLSKSSPVTPLPKAPLSLRSADWNLLKPEIIVIGSSTGGPNALELIFKNIKAPLSCPILIAQHMPPIFTATLAERLSGLAKMTITEARDGEPVLSNRVYVAPGDYHMSVAGDRSNPVIKLDRNPPINFVRPAVDPLFSSAAALFGSRCLGIVLTGMGHDGRDGAVAVKQAGGYMFIQNQESCVVFGMPGAVKEVKAFDREIDLESLANLLNSKIGTTTTNLLKKAQGA